MSESVDQSILNDICDRIESSPEQETQLIHELIALAELQQLDMQCAVFNTMIWRTKIQTANPYRIMLDTFMLQQRFDLAFIMAGFSMQIDPDPFTRSFMFWKLFQIFLQKQNPKEAIAVFLQHHKEFPDAEPLGPAWQIAQLSQQADYKLPVKFLTPWRGLPPARSESIRVQQPTTAAAYAMPVYGSDTVPRFLRELAGDVERPAIDVVRLSEAKLLILDRVTCVVDAENHARPVLSSGEYPMLIQERLAAIAARSSSQVEHVKADVAILISDVFVGPNLCHILLDHVTRLALYEQAGVDISKALVIGGAKEASFQTEILAHLGINLYLDVSRKAEIEARTLYISTNVKEIFHPAHRGAAWALNFLRKRFLPAVPGQVRKIYISRRDARARRVHNEEDVETLLHRWGFTTLVLTNMPFSEQVRAFSGATHIVSPHGAGLTNAVFCSPGTHVLEMFHPLYGTIGYAALARSADWSYSALVGRDCFSEAPQFNDEAAAGNPGLFGDRNFRVDLAALERWLQDTTPPLESRLPD